MPKTVEELAAEVAQLNSTIENLKKDNEKQAADLKEKETEFSDLKEKLEKENEDLKAAAAKAEEEKADLADSDAIDKLISAKKVMPGEKDAILMTLKGLRGKEAQEYELAEGKKEKLTPKEFYLKKQEERPVLDLADEVFNKPKPNSKPGLTKLEVAIKEKLKVDAKLSYNEAMSAVLSENPDFNNAAIANEPA